MQMIENNARDVYTIKLNKYSMIFITWRLKHRKK